MWWLLSTLAFAESTTQLKSWVSQQEGPVVMGVRGSAEKAELEGALGVPVVVVFSTGDLEDALREQGARCGLLLRRPRPGYWESEEVCVEASVASAPSPARSSAAGAVPDAAADEAALLAAEDPQAWALAELSAEADPHRAARLSSAIAVLGALQQQGRSDPFVTKLFVRAAMSADPSVRGQALTQAMTGGDPPMVEAGAPAPVAAAAPAPAPAANLATLHVLRAKDFGFGVPVVVEVNGEAVGRVWNREQLTVLVPAGSVEVTIRTEPGLAVVGGEGYAAAVQTKPDWASLRVEVPANGVGYLEVIPKLGAVSMKVDLVALSAGEGPERAARCEDVTGRGG